MTQALALESGTIRLEASADRTGSCVRQRKRPNRIPPDGGATNALSWFDTTEETVELLSRTTGNRGSVEPQPETQGEPTTICTLAAGRRSVKFTLALRNMKRIIRNTFGITAIAVVAGCATGRTPDLRDCGKLSVGFGPGLGVDAQLGALSHPALGIGSWTRRVGWEDRYVAGLWKEGELHSPAANIAMGVVDGGPETIAGRINVSYIRFNEGVYGYHNRDALHFRKVPDYGCGGYWINTFKSKKKRRNMSTFHQATNLELGASVLLISARVGVNPLEILDFILGFVGLDIAKDDPERTGTKKPTTESTPTN